MLNACGKYQTELLQLQLVTHDSSIDKGLDLSEIYDLWVF